MTAESDKAKLAEKHARFSRNASFVSAGVAVAALIANAIIGSMGLWHSDGNTLKSAVISADAAEHNICLSWASFVVTQQRSPDNTSKNPDVVDSGIDRMGQVIYSRATAETADTIAHLAAQFGGPSPAPAPSSPVALTNITAHCGSAHELRMARETNDPLVLDYNING